MPTKNTSKKLPDLPKAEDLFTENYGLPYFQPQAIKAIHTLCGPRPIDALLHLPRDVIDRRHVSVISEASLDNSVTLEVNVIKHNPVPYRRGFRRPYSIDVRDDSGVMKLIFFNGGKWLERAYPQGENVIIHGQLKKAKNGNFTMAHPDVWASKRGVDNVAKLWPRYRLTKDISQLNLKRAVDTLLPLARTLSEWLPEEVITRHKLPSTPQAIHTVHNPESIEDTEPTSAPRVRLALDEILAHQMAFLYARNQTKVKQGISHTATSTKTLKLLESIPYNLTADQTQTYEDICADLSLPSPMLRLVQGDVGSGKTIVSLLALLRAIECGSQGALVAPTEILAQQHYENACKLLQPLGINIVLLVGSIPAARKKKIKQHIADGLIHLVIGTHAILQPDIQFHKLGLAVIDEQHRFGVMQRLSLTDRAPAPDVLLLTATPIPRTLALTYYGDMDVSLIKTKPPGRTPITTKAFPLERMGNIVPSLQRILDKNEQVYWVCPLVEESESSDLASAEERFNMLKHFYGDTVGLLHGKMKPADKETIMERFKAGDLRILVSTTVIEVGVDVPQATCIVIEHAERFGLSQLHQLRGRVGRSNLQSSCLLLYDNNLTEAGQERLQAMRDSEDGFYLAEKDLELRGFGELLGTKQSGDVRMKVADLYHHRQLIPLARDIAETYLSEKLSTAQKTALVTLLKIYNKDNVITLLSAG